MVDDRLFILQVYGKGESGWKSQEELIDLELEGVDAAENPGISSKTLLFERFFIEPYAEVVSGGELFEVVPDAFSSANGVRRKGWNEHRMFMIEMLDFFNLSGAYPGNPF
jgi:hypothetical protein